MPPLLQYTIFGPLELVEVLVEHDGPRLFTCRDSDGRLYLAVSVDESESDEIWLYAPLSGARLEQLRAGQIDLHDAFACPEEGHLYRVTAPANGASPSVEPLAPTQIPAEWLPAPGEFLERAG